MGSRGQSINKIRIKIGQEPVHYDNKRVTAYARYLWRAYSDAGRPISWSEALKRAYNDAMLNKDDYRRFQMEPSAKGDKSAKIDAATYDPVHEYRRATREGRGAEEFREQLNSMTEDELHGIINRHHLDSSRRTKKWKKGRLVDYIYDVTENKATQGDNFFNS